MILGYKKIISMDVINFNLILILAKLMSFDIIQLLKYYFNDVLVINYKELYTTILLYKVNLF